MLISGGLSMSDQENNFHEQPDQQEPIQLPPALESYFKIKKALKGPDLIRDEDGLSPKRFSRKYFEDTCPFCETTAEHEGRKFKYSKVTRRKIITNIGLMLATAFITGIGLLNVFVGLAVILVLGYTTSVHAERKMYYSFICRNCGAHFPMDKEEQDKIREEEREKKAAAQQSAAVDEEENSTQA
jgi:hypothetical protein